jgi:phage baseplate assembly protein W
MSTRPFIGWPLLPQPDAAGRLSFASSLDQSVRDAIRVILTTRPGELLAHPDFGAGLDVFLNDLSSLELRREIHTRIADSLARWEPRIDVDRISVDEVADEPSQLRVEIAYRLRRTGLPQALGFTLQTGA